MSDQDMTCQECGMLCDGAEYHPYAACLMFKACRDSKTVRENLYAVRNSTATTNPPEISSTSALRKFVLEAKHEHKNKSPEQPWRGTEKFINELEALIERLTSNIPDTTALKGQ